MTEENNKDEKPKKPKKAKPTEEELASPRTSEQFNLSLRRTTRLFYDIQAMRLQAQGRLTKKSPTNPIELHPRDLQRLHARVHDLEVAEKNALKDLDAHLHEVPFYATVILPERKGRFKGLGPRMASIIVSSFDIKREETVSQMWAFAGLAPVVATRCKQCSVVVVEASDPGRFKHPKPQGNKCAYAGKDMPGVDTFASGKAMKPVAGEKLKYNAWLRTKLMGVLAEVLIKLKSPYTQFYYNYKTRKTEAGWGTSDGHRHWAAKRYMIKMLLLDIWKEWRTFEKLPVRGTYQEEYLGHTHHTKHDRPIKTVDDVRTERDPLIEEEVNEALEDDRELGPHADDLDDVG